MSGYMLVPDHFKVYNPETHVVIEKNSAGQALRLLELVTYRLCFDEDRRKAAVADITQAIARDIIEVGI